MKFRSSIAILGSLLMFLTFIPTGAYAQTGSDEAEEISVGFAVPEVGTVLLPAFITADERLYLPVAEIFSFLRVRIDSLADPGVLSGYIFDEKRTFRIDAAAGRIEAAGTERDVKDGEMIVAAGRAYLRSDLFGTLFGLRCTFDFGDLEVRLFTDYELPAVREARRESARRTMRGLYEAESFEREAREGGALIRPGVADWTVTGTLDSLGRVSAAYTLDLGAEVLGGAMRVRLEGENDSIAGHIPWEWRYVDNDFAPARQVTLGNVPSLLPEPFAATALGASVTNRSTLTRTAYGAYVIQDRTEPEWDVELYVNNSLADVVTADANGIYRFEIPFRYGATDVRLRFFGPYGEERTMEKTLRIPLTMLPAGEVEYTVAGGLLEGEGSGLFAHAKGEVGVGSMLTLGGGIYGVQYNAPESWYPYVTGSARLTNSLFLSGQYSPSTGGEGSLSWMTPMQGTVELGYRRGKRYTPRTVGGDWSDPADKIEEKRTLSFSTPLPFAGTAQARITDNVLSYGHAVQGEGTVAARFMGLPVTLEMRGEWVANGTWTLASFRTGVRTFFRPWNLASVRPSMEFDLRSGRIASGRLELERQIAGGMWANVALLREFAAVSGAGNVSAQFGVRMDLPFARTNTTGRYEKGGFGYTTTASGSVAWDSRDGAVVAENRSAADRASLTIRPFLDLNGNDTLDAGEPPVPELDVVVSGGIVRHRASDSTIRVLGLEPYRPRVLRVDESSLPEISWRARYKTWKVTPRPNRFERIDLPIVVVGEAAGKVTRGADGTGMRGVLVRFRQLDGDFTDSTITYDDGEFFYMGLPPGRYSVSPDAEQMRILGFDPETASIEFVVKPGREGDIIEGIEFSI